MRKSIFLASLFGALFWTVLPEVAWACPSCYGAISNTEVAHGLQLAMLALIGAIAMVGAGVVLFFSNIKKRSAMYAAGELKLANGDSLAG